MTSPFVSATIDGQHRLRLSSLKHQIPWLEGKESVLCIVEVPEPGLVKIGPLSEWAASKEMSPQDAQELLERPTLGADDFRAERPYPCVGTARMLKDGRRGPTQHEIQLPDVAVFSLFRQGQGPLALRRGRPGGEGGTCLLARYKTYFELWARSFL